MNISSSVRMFLAVAFARFLQWSSPVATSLSFSFCLLTFSKDKLAKLLMLFVGSPKFVIKFHVAQE